MDTDRTIRRQMPFMQTIARPLASLIRRLGRRMSEALVQLIRSRPQSPRQRRWRLIRQFVAAPTRAAAQGQYRDSATPR